MADADLRALERRWLESASVDDEARWHAARLRAGLVTERGLVIAAGLGHEAALRLAPAVGLTPLELFDRPELELRAPSDSPRVRAAIGLARAMATLHAHSIRDARGHVNSAVEQVALVETSVAAAERWARCPCRGHADALACFDEAPINDCVPDCCWHSWDFPAQLIGFALDVVAEFAGRAPRGGWNYESAVEMFGPGRSRDLPEDLERAAEEAIRATVLPWALALFDPLHGAS